MAIYDAMQHIRPDVRTICFGMGMSAAAVIVAGGAAGKRFALPNAKLMIHQGSAGYRGTPADIDIAAREVLSTTRQMAAVLACHTGRDVERVLEDIDRDRFMTPDEAVAYGLVDQVLLPRRAGGEAVASAA
jgi:ATP-dependent Clp protease protease subunit